MSFFFPALSESSVNAHEFEISTIFTEVKYPNRITWKNFLSIFQKHLVFDDQKSRMTYIKPSCSEFQSLCLL